MPTISTGDATGIPQRRRAFETARVLRRLLEFYNSQLLIRRVTWGQSEQMVALLGSQKTHLFSFSMMDPSDASIQ